MAAPVWISARLTLVIHDEQLAEHGGAVGLRDQGLLDSALHRPIHLFSYASPDMPALAASYAHGLARNHPFVDGNKRTSFVACLTFLGLNSFELVAGDAEKVTTWMALADGRIAEGQLAEWIRARVKRQSV